MSRFAVLSVAAALLALAASPGVAFATYSSPPIFSSPQCNTTFTATVGGAVSFLVSAYDPDTWEIVTLGVVNLPAGAAMTPALPQDGNPVSSSFSWTPAASQVGTHVVTFIATGSGYDVNCSVTIKITDPGTPNGGNGKGGDPGSVLVFPKFIRGTVTTPDQGVLPKSQFEVSVTCPHGAVCAQNQQVRLVAHWVCPGTRNAQDKFVCRETDFELVTTVNGTIIINPHNLPPANQTVPRPACPEGYLIMWVVSPSDSTSPAISFNALSGHAVLRPSPDAAGAYNAVGIPSVLGPGSLTDVSPKNGGLDFNGAEYAMVPGQVRGTVRYASSTPTSEVDTYITLLTLDVKSNRVNHPVFVDLIFYTPTEVPLSTAHSFVCWSQVKLTDIDANLVESFMGWSGLMESGPAEKMYFPPTPGGPTPVTLMGIIEVRESAAGGGVLREYDFSLVPHGPGVKTLFLP